MLLVAIAIVLTAFFVYVLFDSMTGDYVGSELQAVVFLTGVAGVLTVAAWGAALSVLRGAKRRE